MGGGDASPTVIALGKTGCVEAMRARFGGLSVHMPLHGTKKKEHIASTPSQNLASQEETKITDEMKTNVQLVGRWDFYNKAHGFHLFQLKLDFSARRWAKDGQRIHAGWLINKSANKVDRKLCSLTYLLLLTF